MTIDNETKERAKAWQAAQTKKAVEQKEDMAIKPAVVIAPKPAVVIAPKPTNAQRDCTAAKRIACKIIKQFEGCELRSYPDIASPLGKALLTHGLFRKFVDGKIELPEHFAELSGAPWSAMYGETQGIKQGMVFTQEQADAKLQERVEGFMKEVLIASPVLAKHSDEKLAAVTSLVYNIGLTEYETSTARKRIAAEDFTGAAEALAWFNKAQGKIEQGLINRRGIEKNLFLSVTN